MGLARDSGEMPVAIRRNSAQKIAGRHTRAERSSGGVTLSFVGASSQKLLKSLAIIASQGLSVTRFSSIQKSGGGLLNVEKNFLLQLI